MKHSMKHSLPFDLLRNEFGERFIKDAPLAKYTTARTGGNAAGLVTINNSAEFEHAAKFLWDNELPFRVFGNGSNILVCDEGLDEIVLLNKANAIRINPEDNPPTIWAESGALLGNVAKLAAEHGMSGLEWAYPIPGTVGGAVYGNAGAHGSDVENTLVLAEILHCKDGRQIWTPDQLDFQSRSSKLKRGCEQVIILSATFVLSPSTPDAVQNRMDEIIAKRKKIQPQGASMGSMFKNPPGDFAARLIDQAGLKGTRIGGVTISTKHANFFINDQNASAEDVWKLAQLVKKTVKEKFGVMLELEVELLGNWQQPNDTELS
jgi:UDP-N-acetylmuramate dehydrogenase